MKAGPQQMGWMAKPSLLLCWLQAPPGTWQIQSQHSGSGEKTQARLLDHVTQRACWPLQSTPVQEQCQEPGHRFPVARFFNH